MVKSGVLLRHDERARTRSAEHRQRGGCFRQGAA